MPILPAILAMMKAAGESSSGLSSSLGASGASSIGDAARAEGTAGSGPPPLPTSGGSSTSPGTGSASDPILMTLQEILKAIQALKEQSSDPGPIPGKPLQAADEALGSALGNTNLGRFVSRVRKIAKKTRSGIKMALGSKGGPKGIGAAGTGGGAGAAEAAGGSAAMEAGAAGVGVGGALGVAAVFAAAVIEFGKAVYEFGRAQEQEVRRLAQYGGNQAEAAALLDADRAMRDIKTAEETGGSSKDMMDSLSKLEESFQPIESLLTNISNTVVGRLMDVISGILDAVKPIVDALKDIYDALPDNPFKSKKADIESNWALLDRTTKEFEKNSRPKWPMNGGGSGPRGGSNTYGGG